MCGRAVLNADLPRVVAELAIDRYPDEIPQRYNISPGYLGSGAPWIVRVAEDGKREMLNARWWLIPAWWNQELKKLPTTFNARAETIATSKFFRDAFRSRRCLMPANAWYEYQGKPGKKRSFCFHLPDWKPFAFAGIYETWLDREHGEIVTSFAIATSEPSAKAAEIHDRMPVVLAPEHHAAWLDPQNHDTDALQKMLQPWGGELEIYETRGFGNNPRYEAADCLEPVRGEDLALTLF